MITVLNIYCDSREAIPKLLVKIMETESKPKLLIQISFVPMVLSMLLILSFKKGIYICVLMSPAHEFNEENLENKHLKP